MQPTARNDSPNKLHRRILIGALLGIIAGMLAYATTHYAWGSDPSSWTATILNWVFIYVMEPAGKVFRGLLLMLAIPLTFSALVLGVAGFGDLRALGRVGLKTLLLTIAGTTIAVILGISLVALVRPGDSPRAAEIAKPVAAAAPAAAPKSGIDFFLDIIPANPIKSAAEGNFLAIMLFALLFGVALACTKTNGAARLKEVIEGIWDVSLALMHMVLAVAPYGVFALLYTVLAKLGVEVLLQLVSYVAVVVLALALHLVVFQGLLVRVLGGMSPIAFFRAIQDAMITAFSTSSSNATLPTTLMVADEKLKLPPAISRFVLTIGATANQHGTALFEGVTVLFLAQFYHIDLTLGEQLLVVGVSLLGGIGAAGVPSGSIPVIVMILAMVRIPPEGIGIILGVDRLLDMCRTVVNVTGDLAIATVIARSEEKRAQRGVAGSDGPASVA